MKRHRVVVAPDAADNIEEAYHWYAAQNPAAAELWREVIEAAILGLSTIPERCPVAAESGALDFEVRQLLYGRNRNWRVLFAVEGSSVLVLHVRHSRRDYWRPPPSDRN